MEPIGYCWNSQNCPPSCGNVQIHDDAVWGGEKKGERELVVLLAIHFHRKMLTPDLKDFRNGKYNKMVLPRICSTTRYNFWNNFVWTVMMMLMLMLMMMMMMMTTTTTAAAAARNKDNCG